MQQKDKTFYYSYSGESNDELNRIKAKYTNTNSSLKLQEVRKLDRRVDFVATIISIVLGMTGTAFLVFAVAEIIKNGFSVVAGIGFAVGIIIVSFVPMIHVKIVSKIREFTAPRILALIKEIEQNR